MDVRTKAPKPFLLVKTNEVSEFWLQPLSTLRVQKNFFCKSYLNTITSVYTIAEFFGSIVQHITIRIYIIVCLATIWALFIIFFSKRSIPEGTLSEVTILVPSFIIALSFLILQLWFAHSSGFCHCSKHHYLIRYYRTFSYNFASDIN